ncbi:TPA: outer membrane usher protein [Klebsiella aerogenes]|nr:outer membrane usher protein [Klebsiella aerogenes]
MGGQVWAEEIQFNTDVLDIKDRTKIDLGQFAKAGYLMPGDYQLTLRINETELPEKNISFFVPDDDPKGSAPCLTADIVQMLGLKDNLSRSLKWWHNGQCLNLSSLPGMEAHPDLGVGSLFLNIPQAYLEYANEYWDPPSRWDNGVSGILFDYSLNGTASRQQSSAQQTTVSGNGIAGVNLGSWRLRADWQALYDRSSGNSDSRTQQSWTWDRYYLYRAVTSLRAKLMLGENTLPSSMFDSFDFTGASLTSDDAQLPPNLRGYAPEITGIANTNAKVTISQQGHVLYETTVAAGPFRIQDLDDTVIGRLDVRVQEQDGSIRTWQVNTASIPYLTRPGTVRYKISAGKPSNGSHHLTDARFLSAELSDGISNGWSLFGGGMFAGDYNALALGIGRDLLVFGAISADVTESRASLPGRETTQGGSYRLSYSKRFDEYDSQVTFAGYRFSERGFMTMSQYLNARYHSVPTSGQSKELYTISLNKEFRKENLSAYLNYSHQTYWDRPANDTWSASLTTYFDAGSFHNVTLGLSASRTQYYGMNDDGLYLTLSLPWGNRGNISYGGQFSGKETSHNISLNSSIDDNNNYSMRVGVDARGEHTGSGYFTHEGSLTELTANASVQDSKYSAVGLSLQGGITATPYGVAMHRANTMGGTRLMVDTAGIRDVPVHGYGSDVTSNALGKAVITDISSYYRSTADIDLDSLPDDVEAIHSTVQDTLTEGAIGYRKFGLLAGAKAMTIIRLADGTAPPFGAVVTNEDSLQVGIVGEDGNTWLTGLQPGKSLRVSWGEKHDCPIHIPVPLAIKNDEKLLLPCVDSNRQSKT